MNISDQSVLWCNKSPTLYVTQTIQPQSNENSYGDAAGRLFTTSCLSDPNLLDELWQKCTLPSATVNKFQKGRAGCVSQASWLLTDMKKQFRKHLSAFTSTHPSRQVSSGQTLTNLRLDTLSPWNMPVPKQWVTDQGLTFVQHAACAERRREKEVCVCDTYAHTYSRVVSEKVSQSLITSQTVRSGTALSSVLNHILCTWWMLGALWSHPRSHNVVQRLYNKPLCSRWWNTQYY